METYVLLAITDSDRKDKYSKPLKVLEFSRQSGPLEKHTVFASKAKDLVVGGTYEVYFEKKGNFKNISNIRHCAAASSPTPNPQPLVGPTISQDNLVEIFRVCVVASHGISQDPAKATAYMETLLARAIKFVSDGLALSLIQNTVPLPKLV